MAALNVLIVTVTVGAAEPAAPTVRLERVAGEPVRGRLVAIEADTIRIEAQGDEQALAVEGIRRVVSEVADQPAPPAVLVTTTDGSTLSGADFLQEGEQGIVTLPTGRMVLPIDRVRRVAWLPAGGAAPEWLDELPERPAADVVVVRRETGHAFVECAIVGVAGDAVTVVLDGETIPVKRAKVLGVAWLREPAASGRTPVAVTGGELAADRVRWSPEGLVLDDLVRLPAAAVRAIDYAAGRTTPLAEVPIETSSVEPFFGGLAARPGLAAFFAPRAVADEAGEGPAAIVVRPRTVATWRVPTDSRRFRAAIGRDVPAQAAAAVDVSLAVDGNEVFRRRLGGPAGDDAEPVAIDVEVAGGRRLTLTVAFVPGDMGCGVRLAGGAFEK
ncbi:MAG: hypothetical protein ACKOCX_00720 [Planctomycetota bacterium]